jgi:hypothetical protein
MLLLGACGGEDDSNSSSSSSAARPVPVEPDPETRAHNAQLREEYEERRQSEAPSEEETEAKQAATRFYEILDAEKAPKNKNKAAIDSASFCDLMSEEAVAQTIHYAKVSSGIQQQWDCESAVDLLVIRSKRAGGFGGVRKAEVIGVNAEGDRATATVKFGGGAATSIPLVREDGEWKLAATAVGGK